MTNQEILANRIAQDGVRNACEWDDRTSPEGYEEYMFMLPNELEGVIRQAIDTYEKERPSLAFTLDKARKYAADQKERIDAITDPAMRQGVIDEMKRDRF